MPTLRWIHWRSQTETRSHHADVCDWFPFSATRFSSRCSILFAIWKVTEKRKDSDRAWDFLAVGPGMGIKLVLPARCEKLGDQEDSFIFSRCYANDICLRRGIRLGGLRSSRAMQDETASPLIVRIIISNQCDDLPTTCWGLGMMAVGYRNVSKYPWLVNIFTGRMAPKKLILDDKNDGQFRKLKLRIELGASLRATLDVLRSLGVRHSLKFFGQSLFIRGGGLIKELTSSLSFSDFCAPSELEIGRFSSFICIKIIHCQLVVNSPSN